MPVTAAKLSRKFYEKFGDYLTNELGDETDRLAQAFDMRWFLPAELTHVLERSGFAVSSIYGAFDRSPLTDSSPEIIVISELIPFR